MPDKPVIGLLGGGQLGRMTVESAGPLGIEIVVLDQAECPVRQISSNHKHVTGSFNDAERIRELAAKCDVLTIEIEHVDTEVLEEIATRGVKTPSGELKKVPVHPSWETIRLIQDKYLQKKSFDEAGSPVAPQVAVEANVEALKETAQQFGFPFMLKARKGSYDGRGNFKIRNAEDFDQAIKTMGSLSLYAEKWVPFEKELAVMVVRTEDEDGRLRNVHPYPTVETIHEDSICTKVFYPPRQVSTEISLKAQTVAADVVRTLKGRGIFAVEMFLLGNGDILVNEVAPRPHNSGHLFIEAIPYMSQFKAQIYAILDLFPETFNPQPRVSAALMLNILGGAQADSHEPLVKLTETLYHDDLDVFLHLYGKASKPGRKIGHITLVTHQRSSDLKTLSAPFIDEVDRIRFERIGAGPPTASPPPHHYPRWRDPINPLVVVTMGSDSDLHVLRGAFEVLERFGVPYDFTITSAHRTPHRMVALGKSAVARGIRVFIAAAGGAAHLPGMLASETPVPVIGVPVKATHLDGHDSLLSIVQMPRGCPVATVGINNSTNAALLAIKILGTSDSGYRDKMTEYMKSMSDEVEAKAATLAEIGWIRYLTEK